MLETELKSSLEELEDVYGSDGKRFRLELIGWVVNRYSLVSIIRDMVNQLLKIKDVTRDRMVSFKIVIDCAWDQEFKKKVGM